MDYIKRGKQREIKRNLEKTFDLVKFKSIHLSLEGKIIMIGVLLSIISLFFPWIIDLEHSLSWNSFNAISGNIGFFIIIILGLISFITLSTNKKEKIKLHSNLTFKDYFIVISGGLFVIFTSIIALSFINGLKTFFENIAYGNGAILSTTAGIIITVGGVIMRKNYKKNNLGTVINESENMIDRNPSSKLPF